MIVVNHIRENKEEIINKLKIKNFDAAEPVNKIIELDNNRREYQKQLDDSLAEVKRISKEIGSLYKSGEAGEANKLKQKTADLKSLNNELQEKLNHTTGELNTLLLTLPNIPHEKVPPGKGEEDNKVIFENGEIPKKEDFFKPHWELAKKYDIIDFDLGNKITGSGFPVYKGKGAKLQRALIWYFLDMAAKAGYEEIQPPYLVNEESGYGTGQLPDKDGQMYALKENNFYLIPTAEVPVTNIYRDVILKAEDLPVKNVAYSACFRREAGSHGKDVRGLNRLHQFDKVEIVQVQHPEKSYETLEEMKDYIIKLLNELGLPYRIAVLCGGDLSFTSALTYDMEVFSVAQERWLEVSSVSNFESYQANRLKLRFREDKNKPQLAHTLNGSALALPRIMAAILENYQEKDGIAVPKVLRPFTGFDKIT